jgi:adenylate cyclase
LERRLAAILAADVVGYSKLMGEDQVGTLDALRHLRKELFEPLVTEHNGTVIKRMGDGWIVEFASVSDGVDCAIRIQEGLTGNQVIRLRVGIHIGEVVVEDEDIYGDGVNVAARLEALAAPGQVVISDTAYNSLDGKSTERFVGGESQELKNIARPVAIWRWAAGGEVMSIEATALPLPDKPSIAVLPFENMSGDPEQEYFADGLAEDIITGLSQTQGLFVIARNSSFVYKGIRVDVKKVGRELGVQYVMEGSVRRSGNRVRITAQVIDATSDTNVWADRYDGSLDDVFSLQDEITNRVLSTVGTEITLAEMGRAVSKRSSSFVAWDYYLQALHEFHHITKGRIEIAKGLLHTAIELDPRFATAYATLARCHIQSAHHGWGHNSLEEIKMARKWAQNAIDLDPHDALAHLAIGQIFTFDSMSESAIKELNRAIELNPNLSLAHGLLANTLGFLGETEAALSASKKAIRGSPRDPDRYVPYLGIMNAQFAAGRYEECVAAAEQGIILQPNFYGGYCIMAAALPYLDRIEEAKEALEQCRKVMPRLTLKGVRRNPMFVRSDDIERLLEGLRHAGLCE